MDGPRKSMRGMGLLVCAGCIALPLSESLAAPSRRLSAAYLDDAKRMELGGLPKTPLDPSNFDIKLTMHASGVYTTLDSNSDGKVTWEEFHKAFFKDPIKVGTALGEEFGQIEVLKSQPQELTELFAKMDADRSGGVSWEEFRVFIYNQMLGAREIDANYLWRAKQRMQERLHPTQGPTVPTFHPTMPSPSPTFAPSATPSKRPTVNVFVLQRVTDAPTARPTLAPNEIFEAHAKEYAKEFNPAVAEMLTDVIPTKPTPPTHSPTLSPAMKKERRSAEGLLNKAGWNLDEAEHTQLTWLDMQAFYALHNPKMIPHINDILTHFTTEMIIDQQMNKYAEAIPPPAPTPYPTAFPVPTVWHPTPPPTAPTPSPSTPTHAPIFSMLDLAGPKMAKAIEKKMVAASGMNQSTWRWMPTHQPTQTPTLHPATASPTVYMPEDKQFGFDWVEGMVPKAIKTHLTPEQKRARLQYHLKREKMKQQHQMEEYKLKHGIPLVPTGAPTENGPTRHPTTWFQAGFSMQSHMFGTLAPSSRPTPNPSLYPTSFAPTKHPTHVPTLSPTAEPTLLTGNLQAFANIFHTEVKGYKPTLPPTKACQEGMDDPHWQSTIRYYSTKEKLHKHITCKDLMKARGSANPLQEQWHQKSCLEYHDKFGNIAFDFCQSACCHETRAPTTAPTRTPSFRPTWSPSVQPTSRPTHWKKRSHIDSQGHFIFGEDLGEDAPTRCPTSRPSRIPTAVGESLFDKLENGFDEKRSLKYLPTPKPTLTSLERFNMKNIKHTPAPTPESDAERSHDSLLKQAASWYSKMSQPFLTPEQLKAKMGPTPRPTGRPSTFPTSFPTFHAFVENFSGKANAGEAKDVKAYLLAQLDKIDNAEKLAKVEGVGGGRHADLLQKQLEQLAVRRGQLEDVLESIDASATESP